jgi:adenylate kinase
MKDSYDERNSVHLILLGLPGAGKGTQAQSLAKRLGCVHVSSGDLFRKHQVNGTDTGKLVETYMQRGELVPDHVTIQIILKRLQENDCTDGYVLDGFPRTFAQAQALDKALHERHEIVNVALYINVDQEELVRRLNGRLICRKCQTPFHEVTAPPRKFGVCDDCTGELYHREDDKPDAVRRRVQLYLEQTVPLLDYYRTQGKLREVDGQGSIDKVGHTMTLALAN